MSTITPLSLSTYMQIIYNLPHTHDWEGGGVWRHDLETFNMSIFQKKVISVLCVVSNKKYTFFSVILLFTCIRDHVTGCAATSCHTHHIMIESSKEKLQYQENPFIISCLLRETKISTMCIHVPLNLQWFSVSRLCNKMNIPTSFRRTPKIFN